MTGRPRKVPASPPLGRGDVVGIVSPGFPVDRARLRAGVRALEDLGLRPRLAPSALAREGLFAGTDEARAADLSAMIDDPDVRALLFGRGGYGTMRLLPHIPWRRLASRRVLLVGYSDLTALFAPAIERGGAACVYGPVVTELGDKGAWDRPSLERALFRPSEPLAVSLAAAQVLAPGRATAPLAGGCLTLLAALCGTPWAPRFAGSVLLVEETGEAPYRIDRMLTQMRLAGMLKAIRGVIVGSLAGCLAHPGGARGPSALEVIRAFFAGEKVPVVAGLPIGHCRGKISVPLGRPVRIDTAARSVVFEP